MKTCKSCNTDKEYKEFYKKADTKDGYNNDCIECKRKKDKDYKIRNKQKIKEYNDNYRIDNKESIIVATKKYNENNKERKRKYYADNVEVLRIKRRAYIKNKCLIDPVFKLRRKICNIVYRSYKKEGFNKRTQEVVGCSYPEFKQHLESLFQPWMNWDNYGKFNNELDYGWDIDHIVPICEAKTEEDILRLNHYSNLQPLCSKVNRIIKRAKTTKTSQGGL
jgi:hypothetical protein